MSDEQLTNLLLILAGIQSELKKLRTSQAKINKKLDDLLDRPIYD